MNDVSEITTLRQDRKCVSYYYQNLRSRFGTGLVLSVTRLLRAALTKFGVYVCVTTPPKPLNRFA